jgi:GH18 family chitinase
MIELKQKFANGGYCVSNAVPGTAAYWKNYPKTNLWANSVDWTTVMAYDNYGTFGSKTEHGAALYDLNRNNDKEEYPYPTTSGDIAVHYYYQEGLPAEKIVLGIPFYCHSYYVDHAVVDKQSQHPGLHVPVLDPNINSQISYQDAWHLYGEQLFTYEDTTGTTLGAVSYYGLIPLPHTHVSHFISCDSPASIASKVAYVKGNNSIRDAEHKKSNLGGVAFWSLQQDLPLNEPYSLLRAINNALFLAEG